MESDVLTATTPEVRMAVSQLSAIVFLIPALPIAIWVAWSDMRHMKIPNQAVVALFVTFAVLGLFVLPLETYGWRWVQAIGVLAVGFVMNMIRALGAGDAKFAAAMAAMIAAGDATVLFMLFAAVLLASFATHRLFRAVPAVRNGFSEWKSWTHPKFPMGLALSGALILYLVLGAVFGADPRT
ncbi:prepilin peptidase [Ovoidimarina sediminis]|uniref:prepilin peptidase n=1 Tax=Ovoidimarina sediminis TaxID=3079856 RepID=UPI00290F1D10|nr:prepilin peptidase [Rhodophyticola sp. MJ-SS7]MDU8942959.1 prepilin peptidase [Rhodophyticola sp. MJ-SS7]